MLLWIDNDACPKDVREVIYRAAKRLAIPVKVVANSFTHVPKDIAVEMLCVGSEFDAADNLIAETVVHGDVVITADIPLADRVVKKGAIAICPRGTVYDAKNIAEEVAMRNLRQELRSGGTISGGPPPFNREDLHRFASSLDKLLTSAVRR